MEHGRGAWWRVALAFALVQAIIAGGIAACPLAYGKWRPEDMREDLRIYYTYASKLVQGQVPYRDFDLEYPVAAIPIFVLPRLFAPALKTYWVTFAVEMLLANAATVLFVGWWLDRTEGAGAVARRLAWYSAFLVILCPLALTRYDIVPTLAAFAGACLWYSDHGMGGGILVGMGTLLKIYPGVLLAPGGVWDWTRGETPAPDGERGRELTPESSAGAGANPGAVMATAQAKAGVSTGPRTPRDRLTSRARWGTGTFATITTVATACVAWVGFGGWGVIRSVTYHVEREIEIGSLYSGALMATAKLRGTPLETRYSHFSMELVAEGASSVARLAFPLQAIALLAVAGRFWATGGREPMRYATAAILGFVVFGKVLSPQYLIWLIPFMAVLEGRTGTWARFAFAAACVCTTLIYPWGMHRVVSFHPLAILVLNGRNGLLLVLWLLLVTVRPGSQAKIAPRAVP